MKIGHWFSTHPPIAHRLAALQPSLAEGRLGGMYAVIGAALVLAIVIVIPVAASIGFFQEFWPQFQAAMEAQR